MGILKTAIIASELLLPPKPALWVPAAPAILQEVWREVEAKKRMFLGSMLINPFMVASPSSAPVFVGSQAGNNVGINGSSATVSYGLTGGVASVPAAGDLVVVSYVRGTANGTFITCVISGGGIWSTVVSTSASGSSYKIQYIVGYRFMPGTPDTTFSLSGGSSTTDGMAWGVQVWRNINVATPMDVTFASGFAGGGAGDPPSITPVTDKAIIIGCSMAGGNLTAGPSSASGMLGYAGSWNNDTYDAAAGIAYKQWLTGDPAFNPPSYGGSGSGSSVAGGVTIALRPV